jgi:hypothetical protein
VGGDERETTAAICYRPQIWVAVAFWTMTPLFALMAFGGRWFAPTVDIDCQRQDAQMSCEVATEGLFRPSVARLSDEDLRGGRLALVPEPHDRSFKKVELRRRDSVRPIADFTQNASSQVVRDVNRFLDDSSSPRVCARLVAASYTEWQLLPFQLIGLLTLAGGVYSLNRRTTLTASRGELVVRHTRWPWRPLVRRWPLQDIAGIEVVSRFPDRMEQLVTSLPWRNIYRGTALAIRTTAGAEFLITDLSKRSCALHERMAATLRSWLPFDA